MICNSDIFTSDKPHEAQLFRLENASKNFFLHISLFIHKNTINTTHYTLTHTHTPEPMNLMNLNN